MNLPNLKKVVMRRYVVYLVIVLISFTISWGISNIRLFKQFENKILDTRFSLRGDIQLDSTVVLILVDEETRQKIGEAPYPREIFAGLIEGLEKAEASVIGLDFLFEGQQSKDGDSLLTNVAKRFDNIVFSCYFRKIFEPITMHTNQFFQSREILLPYFHSTMEERAFAHINIFVDSFDGASRSLPLFVCFDGRNYSAFSLEIIKKYWNIDNDRMEVKPEQILLFPHEFKRHTIPMCDWSEYLINFMGFNESFSNYYSLSDVMDYLKNSENDPLLGTARKIFKDKIVLIGSIIDEDLFVTPFSVQYPGILIHATVINNILRQDFVKEADEFFRIVTYSIIGLCLFVIPFFRRPMIQLSTLLGLLIFYSLFAYAAFYYKGLIVPVFTPFLFVFLTAGSLIILGYFFTTHEILHLKSRLQIQSQRLASYARNFYGFSQEVTFIRIFIVLVQSQDRCFILHWLQKREEPTECPSPLLRKRGSRHPVPLKVSEINRLLDSVQNTWRDYALYLSKGEKQAIKPIERLKNIGLKIYGHFTLESSLRNIFRYKDNELFLSFVLDDSRIPWYWAFSPIENAFLCDQFPMGISFMSREAPTSLVDRKPPSQADGNPTKTAILFSGVWENNPLKKLRYAPSEVEKLAGRLKQEKAKSIIVMDDVVEFLNLCGQQIDSGFNIRIIHYVGHAENDYLDIAQGQYLKPGMMKETKDLYFHSHPLVFLNACNSGQILSPWYQYQNLVTEFLACGAAACIATTGDVAEACASQFIGTFYKYFIKYKSSAGEALRQTREELSKPRKNLKYDPDYDITRYFYVLYGDPTVKF